MVVVLFYVYGGYCVERDFVFYVDVFVDVFRVCFCVRYYFECGCVYVGQ